MTTTERPASAALPIAELVEDMALYPRHTVDDAHVGAVALAVQAGASLPPIVADVSSKRIIDGWHRARAYRRVHGPSAVAEVELRRYSGEDEMLLDAIALNAGHGRRLDKMDQTRCVLLAEERGIGPSLIAHALRVPVERVAPLRVRYAEAPRPVPGAVPGTTKVVLKRPVRHLEGTELSAEQASAVQSAPGTSYLLIVHQLRDALRHGLLNMADARLLDALRDLTSVLEHTLGEHART